MIRHTPHTNFYGNVFAFEIARRNGALAPAFRPVRFLLNGEHIGNYLLGVPSGNCNNIDLVEFMRRRPAWVVHDLGPVVGAGPMYEVAVESAEHAAIEVDGHAKGDGGSWLVPRRAGFRALAYRRARWLLPLARQRRGHRGQATDPTDRSTHKKGRQDGSCRPFRVFQRVVMLTVDGR